MQEFGVVTSQHQIKPLAQNGTSPIIQLLSSKPLSSEDMCMSFVLLVLEGVMQNSAYRWRYFGAFEWCLLRAQLEARR